MSIITNRVQIQKRCWEAPMNEKRHYPVYKWDTAVSTSDSEYMTQVPIIYNADSVENQKPTEEALMTFAAADRYTANAYYLCKFNMSDFNLHGKVSTDMSCDESGRDYFIDIADAIYYANCENPLYLNEDDEPLMYVDRIEDGTFHLNVGFEILAELEERGYQGDVWTVVADRAEDF